MRPSSPWISRLTFALTAFLCACSSSPSPRFFVLEAVAERGAPTRELSILVGPVAIPGEIDRPQFVLSGQGGSEVQIDDAHRWAAPLEESVSRVLSSDLAIQLGLDYVATVPDGGPAPRYRVTVEIHGFQSRLGESALLEASWRVRRGDGASRMGRSMVLEPVQGNDYSALAAAHSRAISRLSLQIADAVREMEMSESPA